MSEVPVKASSVLRQSVASLMQVSGAVQLFQNSTTLMKGIMWQKNFIFFKIWELLSKSFYVLHKIHSHSQLILDPESAFYDHFRGGEAPSEVVVASRFRIQDQVAVAVDFMQNIRTLWPMFLHFDKSIILVPQNAL